MIRFEHEVEMAIRFEVDIHGDTQKYAMSFLHIFNNARENTDIFYKVENSYDSRVYVTCNKDDVDAVEEYLSQFGEILGKEDVKRIKVYPVFGNTKDYNEFYTDDCYTEFVAVED